MDTITRYERALAVQGYASATIRVKVGAVALLLTWTDVAEPADLTTEDVAAWLAAHDFKPWTRIKYLGHVKALCDWAGLEDITKDLRRPPAPPPSPRPAPDGAVAALMADPDSRVRAWTALGAYAGLRSFETAKVAAEDIEPRGDDLVLRIVGKGGQIGDVPLIGLVLEELEPWIRSAGGGRLWPGASSHTVQRTIRGAAARYGYQVSSHQLRHWYGTSIYRASKDLVKTRDLMRHRSAQTTEAYVESESSLLAVLERLPGASRAPAAGGRPALPHLRSENVNLRVIRGGAG